MFKINNKDSPNEQLASQAEVLRQRPEKPDPKNLYKAQLTIISLVCKLLMCEA